MAFISVISLVCYRLFFLIIIETIKENIENECIISHYIKYQ